MDTRDYLRRRVTDALYSRLNPAELFSLARDGDGEAFTALVCRKYAYVASVCRAVLGPAGPVEDITLDVFVTLWRQLAEVREPDRLDGWLARTARNLAAKWAAARARERKAAPAESAGGSDPPAAAERNEIAAKVRRALAELTEDDRAVLALAGATDGAEPAAALLGLPVATYRTRLHRARQRLRIVLERYGLGPLLGLLWTATGAAGRVIRWKKTALVLIALIATTAAGVWRGVIPVPPPGLPAPPVAFPPAEGPTESVPDRNLRVFRAEVLPKQLAALRGLVIGDGEVALRSAEAFDVRLSCVYELRHKVDGSPGWVSAIRLEQDTRAAPPSRPRPEPRTDIYFDAFDRGKWQPIDPARPIILWRNPLTRAEVVLKVAVIGDAVAAFDRLPRDDRTEAELRTLAARLDAAAAPLLGTWYVRGDPLRPGRVELTDGYLTFAGGYPMPDICLYVHARLDPTGHIATLECGNHKVSFSPDGRRLEFHTGEWWSREETPGRAD